MKIQNGDIVVFVIETRLQNGMRMKRTIRGINNLLDDHGALFHIVGIWKSARTGEELYIRQENARFRRYQNDVLMYSKNIRLRILKKYKEFLALGIDRKAAYTAARKCEC